MALPVDWVDMSEPIAEPERDWPYIVLFYPVLRELEATMRTTFVSLSKLDYPPDRCRVVAIPNSNDTETVASLRRLADEFAFLEILEIPPTSDPSWQIVWDSWDANEKRTGGTMEDGRVPRICLRRKRASSPTLCTIRRRP